MINLSKFVGSLDSSDKRVRLLINSLPEELVRVPGKNEYELTLTGVMATLIFDFLMVIGKSVEEAQPVVDVYIDDIDIYCKILQKTLDSNVAEGIRIPMAFLHILDNRFVTLSYVGGKVAGLYDIETDTHLPKLLTPPICSLGVALPALYLNSVAMLTRHMAYANAFKSGKIKTGMGVPVV
jgi:hypothetical protein